MGADLHDPDETYDAPVPERYTAIQNEDGDLILFDAENDDDDAWIQATEATCLTDAR